MITAKILTTKLKRTLLMKPLPSARNAFEITKPPISTFKKLTAHPNIKGTMN